MARRRTASRVLIAGAVGTLLFVPAQGSGQDSLSVACADLSSISPLEDLTRCAQQGQVSARFNLAVKYWAGIGIPKDEIPRLLRPFEQIDRNDRRGREVTGLGLALSNALIQLHEGSLTLDSEPGVGTTVTVRLPL